MKKTQAFLKSAFAHRGSFKSTHEIIQWIKEQNRRVNVKITKTNFKDLSLWSYDENSGNIIHDSGKFFSIDGIAVETDWGTKKYWEQPIINQPEVGYLGFITKEFDGILHFLVQAKIEPGNVNNVQLSPTLQATRSNYTRVHKGKQPLYLDYFRNASHEQILLDQLQSEQGARFLRKRNRNIIIKVEDHIEVYDNFQWMTLGQLKALMRHDNLVNMDSRTVISGIPFGSVENETIDFYTYLSGSESSITSKILRSALAREKSYNRTDDIISFMTHFKSIYSLKITQKKLKSIKEWEFTDEMIFRPDQRYFRVIPVDVQISNREVVQWSQPMVEPAQEGLCAFVCKEIEGILHFAVQAKLECGNHDIIEFAPTVQCLTGNYRDSKEGSLPFLDYVLDSNKNQVLFDCIQSEEGGRFYREQNRNITILAGDEISIELPENFIWMTLNQLHNLLRYNNYLNIQARSLIAALSFI